MRRARRAISGQFAWSSVRQLWRDVDVDVRRNGTHGTSNVEQTPAGQALLLLAEKSRDAAHGTSSFDAASSDVAHSGFIVTQLSEVTTHLV